MANKIVTKGDIKREEWEKKQALLAEQKRIKYENDKKEKLVTESLTGSYKRLVTDSYLSAFAFNYGEEINYSNFDRCFTFTHHKDKNGVFPEFRFNNNSVEFLSDDVRDGITTKDFNQNVREDFVSNDQIINGNILKSDNFSSTEESQSYREGNYGSNIQGITSDNVDNKDGYFISTSSENRYSEFTKITKTRGFSTIESTKKLADTQIEKEWKSQKENILQKIYKGRS